MATAGATRPADDVTGADDLADRRRERSAAMRVGALVVVVVAVAVWAVVRQTWYPTNDIAVIVLRSHDAFGHPPTVGPYSRYGFDHPGPLISYLYAPFVRVFGSSGAILAAGLAAAASAVVSCVVAWRRGGAWLVALTGTVLVLFMRSFDSELVNPWNPWVPVLPFFAFALLLWSVWCRDWWSLPVLVGVGSFAAQTHLSYVPLVGPTLGAALVWCVVRFARKRPDRPSAAVLFGSLALLVVLWLPPLVNQVHSATPNLSAMARHFLGRDAPETGLGLEGGQRPDAAQVAGTTALELGAPAPWMGVPEATDGFTFEIVPASLWRLLPTAAVFGAGLVVGWRRRARDELRLQAIAATLALLGVVGLTRVTGGVWDYLVRWTWVLGSLLWLSALWTLLSCWLRTIDDDRRRRWGRWATLAPFAVALLALPVLVNLSVPDASDSAAVGNLIGPVAAALPSPGERLVYFDLNHPPSLGISEGLVTELVDRGFDVAVPDDIAHRFGGQHALAGREAVHLRVVAGEELASFRPSQDQRLVASYDPLTPEERAEHDRLALRLIGELDAVNHGLAVTDPVSPADRQRFDELNKMGVPAAVYLDTTTL